MKPSQLRRVRLLQESEDEVAVDFVLLEYDPRLTCATSTLASSSISGEAERTLLYIVVIERKSESLAVLFNEELNLSIGAVLLIRRKFNERPEVGKVFAEFVCALRSSDIDCALRQAWDRRRSRSAAGTQSTNDGRSDVLEAFLERSQPSAILPRSVRRLKTVRSKERTSSRTPSSKRSSPLRTPAQSPLDYPAPLLRQRSSPSDLLRSSLSTMPPSAHRRARADRRLAPSEMSRVQ